MEYEDLSERIDRAVKRRKTRMRWTLFAVNLFIFFVFLAVSAYSVASDPALLQQISIEESPAQIAVILPFVGWLMALMFQFITNLTESGVGEKQLRGQVISEEMSEELLTLAMQRDKAKRTLADIDDEDEETITISDDGELIRQRRR